MDSHSSLRNEYDLYFYCMRCGDLGQNRNTLRSYFFMSISKEIELVFLVEDMWGYTALTEAHVGLPAAEIAVGVVR